MPPLLLVRSKDGIKMGTVICQKLIAQSLKHNGGRTPAWTLQGAQLAILAERKTSEDQHVVHFGPARLNQFGLACVADRFHGFED